MTSGTWGCERPPRYQYGIRTAQSIGCTAIAGSLPPNEMPTTGSPALRIASLTAMASSRSSGPSSLTWDPPHCARSPAAFPDMTTASASSTCTLCGVKTTTASGRAAAKRRPSSSMPAAVASPLPFSSGPRAFGMARLPWGAMAAKTIDLSTEGRARRVALTRPLWLWLDSLLFVRLLVQGGRGVHHQISASCLFGAFRYCRLQCGGRAQPRGGDDGEPRSDHHHLPLSRRLGTFGLAG